jgi:hypothetical protein
MINSNCSLIRDNLQLIPSIVMQHCCLALPCKFHIGASLGIAYDMQCSSNFNNKSTQHEDIPKLTFDVARSEFKICISQLSCIGKGTFARYGFQNTNRTWQISGTKRSLRLQRKKMRLYRRNHS